MTVPIQRRASSPLICLQCPIVSSLIRLLLYWFLKRCQHVTFNLKIQTAQRSDLGMMALDRATDMMLFDAVCKTPLLKDVCAKLGLH